MQNKKNCQSYSPKILAPLSEKWHNQKEQILGRYKTMTKAEFIKLVENGPVILDGATGTNLQKAGMPGAVDFRKS